MAAKKKKVSAQEFDRKFDAGEDISMHLDFDAGVKKVNVDLPLWAIQELDREASRRGVARQALIKMWLIDRLDAIRGKEAS